MSSLRFKNIPFFLLLFIVSSNFSVSFRHLKEMEKKSKTQMMIYDNGQHFSWNNVNQQPSKRLTASKTSSFSYRCWIRCHFCFDFRFFYAIWTFSGHQQLISEEEKTHVTPCVGKFRFLEKKSKVKTPTLQHLRPT